ncbi:MAG TPA: Rieske 2Fe-2S domain-containing protein [Solirubrobacteraceae bacterium]|nr:Rieske 2Fe-2S domain-containing protein [Solirubrobacteraceae bacterium]
MNLHATAEGLGGLQQLDGPAGAAAKAVAQVVGQGPLKDLLSGTRLGHPLHPLLTDIPIGALTSATVLDLIAAERGEHAADMLVALGVLAAVPTAAAGAADWSDSYGPDQRVGAVHAIANVIGLGLYGWSLRARRRGDRATGRALGLAGMTSMAVGGYLGGYLSHSRGVGVNNAFHQHGPEDWTAVLDEAQLEEGVPARAVAGDATVLLYRTGGDIHAIGSRCSHAGGPLDEGDVDDASCTVTCPWHQSVFRLEDGSVVHGPASVPQAAYDARINAGRVEVRLRR